MQLGARLVAASLAELEATGGRPSAARIADYFAPAERGGRPLGLTAGNWCAAGACFVAAQVAGGVDLEARGLPHRYRASGLELSQDAERHHGAWAPIAAVRSGQAALEPGDLLIMKRGGESWQRHVARLERREGSQLLCIDANGPGGGWARTTRDLSGASLLGAVVMPRAPAGATGDGAELVALAALALALAL